MMKYYIVCIVTLLLAVSCAAPPDKISDPFGAQVAEGMRRINAAKGDSSLLVITDASYVMHEGRTSEPWIDIISDVTGCSMGSGNLLMVHRPITYHLFAALYNKTTGACVMVAANGSSISVSDTVSLDISTLNDETVWADIQAALGGSEAFSITGIANQWAAGAPFDFLKCAELHNHLCPGVTSGYFIAKFIQKQYPLKEGESYTYISCPSWCKDDGIQVLMDLTPGKRNMYVKNLSNEQKARLTNPAVAGIMLINHGADAGSTALILSFDWDAATEASGAGPLTGLEAKITTLTGLVPFYEMPERFVSVLARKEIDAATASQLSQAGINPYELLEFVK